MKPNRKYFVFPAIVLLTFVAGTNSCKQATQSKWGRLPKGDYIREDCFRSLCESRSPLQTWRQIGAEKFGGLHQITIGGDAKSITVTAGYNFHEGSDAFSAGNDNTLRSTNDVYSMDTDGKAGFDLSDGKSTVHFHYVGDWQLWADRAVIAGSYEDAEGANYIFGDDGVTHFPGNRSFDYKVSLDEVLTDYDYIYSDQLHSTWAINSIPGGIALYDVDENQNQPSGLVAKNPRWRLKQLTHISCQ